MDKRSVQGGDVGISIAALISLAIAEDSFTLLKSFFFDKRYTSAGLLYFVTESEIGIVLTSITSVSFFKPHCCIEAVSNCHKCGTCAVKNRYNSS